MTTSSNFPSLLIINLRSRYRWFRGKFINFHNKSFSIFFVIIHFYIEISASVRFLSFASRSSRGTGFAGEGESCFIHIYRFSFFIFFVWGTHFSNWFQLSFSLSLSPTRLYFYRHRQFAVVIVFYFLFQKEKNRNEYSGRWGDMFQHYVAITIDTWVWGISRVR